MDAQPNRNDETVPGRHAPTVVIVEPDEAVRDSLDLLLHGEGLDPVCFSSGTAALAGLDGLRPCCLVVDLQLPSGRGLEVIDAVAHRVPRLPVILISGLADRPTRRRIERARVDAVLHKPLNGTDLIEAIRRVSVGAAGAHR